MTEEFKPGDVVMLRSGSPRLTVYSVTADSVRAVFWGKREPVAVTIAAFALKRVEEGQRDDAA